MLEWINKLTRIWMWCNASEIGDWFATCATLWISNKWSGVQLSYIYRDDWQKAQEDHAADVNATADKHYNISITTTYFVHYWIAIAIYGPIYEPLSYNTAEDRVVAKRKFAILSDAWWDRRADQLQCAADTSNIKMVHQLLREIDLRSHTNKGHLLANSWGQWNN